MEYKIENEGKNIKVLLIENDEIQAKATCYFEDTPKKDDKNIGCIGDFEAKNKNYGVNLLNKCEEILKEKNISYIVGPMNGNTWKKYRTLKWSNGDPLFLLENVNGIEYNEIFLSAGYDEIETYTSTKGLIKDAYYSSVIEKAYEKLKENNIKIRKFDKTKYEEELKKIYSISKVSFYRNPFYTPISETEFIEQYKNYLDLFNEDFILIAEKENRAIGFIFTIPDYNELKYKEKVQTLILKTVAVIPEYEHLAIGHVLLNEIRKNALDKKYEKWICAFMYSKNTSQKGAKRNKTELIREYALYGKEI